MPPARLARTIDAAFLDGAQVIVIDTPPNADIAAREAVRAADLILIPARARAFDLHAVATTAALVESKAGQAWLVFNALPAGARRLIADASQAVTKMGLTVCPYTLTERAAFHHAPADGKVAAEADPAGKAAREINGLWDWLCQRAGMSACRQEGAL